MIEFGTNKGLDQDALRKTKEAMYAWILHNTPQDGS